MTPDCSITARSSAETVAAAPYMIGFHPSDSIVVMGFAGDLVTFAVRYDLPPPGTAGEGDMARLVARQDVEHVTVLGYGPPALVTPAVLRLARSLAAAGVRVSDAIRVADGRWWSYFCADPRCCPPEGRPADSAFAAAAVYQGLVALPDRKALVARVASITGPEMTAAAERARKRLADLPPGAMRRRAGRLAVRTAEAAYRAGRVHTDDDIAWLGLLLAERDVLGYALDRTVHSGEWLIRLWTDVLRRVEAGLVIGPACLLALTAWRAGNGALARVALDRALRHDPGHHTAGILDRLLGAGIAPSALRDLEPPRRTRRRRRVRRG